MKNVLVGVGAALITVALGLCARQAYVYAEVQGCVKISLSSIESVMGTMPPQIKKQAIPELETGCRQVL